MEAFIKHFLPSNLCMARPEEHMYVIWVQKVFKVRVPATGKEA
jgi:hypothetical protein